MKAAFGKGVVAVLERECPLEIHVLLHILHVCPRYARYYYLGKAVHLVMCGGPMNSRTLCPAVARIFDTAQPVVETGLRLAVEDCVRLGPEAFLAEIAGGDPPRQLSAIEFINRMAAYLLRPSG